MKAKLIICFVFCSVASFSQVGISTETPNAASELHVVAPNNNTGVLIPCLTSAQIAGMTTATHSMLVYNTDNNKFMYNAGNATTQIWTFVGDIPVVADITAYATGTIGDIRYNQVDDKIYYWNGTIWAKLATVAGP